MRRLVETLTGKRARTESGPCVAGFAIVLTALVGCASAETQQVQEMAAGTPPCENLDHTKNIQGQEQAILECAQALDAAQAFDSKIPGTFDENWLDEPQPTGPPKFKCIGTIWPEKRAHANDTTHVGPFRDGGGRVTAKILVQQSPGAEECTGYQQGAVRLYPGVSYAFVYALGREGEHSKKPARVMIVHEDGSLPQGQQFQDRPMHVCWHPDFGYEHAHGRWQKEPVDVRGWWTCVDRGCCNMP